MKAPNFNYVRPASLDEALEILGDRGLDAVPLAGGQSLITTLNLRLSAPEILVDIGDLEELHGISDDGDVIRIGANTRHTEVLNSPIVSEHLPLLAEAIHHVGHVAIRNRGTFGGSLAYGDPAAEMPICVLVQGATMVLASSAGRREVAVEDFYRGLYENDLRSGELLIEARMPKQASGDTAAFAELSRRSGDFAIAGVAASGKVENSQLTQLRLAFLGTDNGPKLAAATAAALVGKPLPISDFAALQSGLKEDCEMSSVPGLSADTKYHLAQVMTRRVIQTLLDRAGLA